MTIPRVGKIFKRRGQSYERLPDIRHETRDGRVIRLAAVVSRCYVCFEPFEFYVLSWQLRGGGLNRCCKAHRSFGKFYPPGPGVKSLVPQRIAAYEKSFRRYRVVRPEIAEHAGNSAMPQPAAPATPIPAPLPSYLE